MSRADAQRRDLSGILLLDKPLGLTSNAALQRVKRLYNVRKAGHTGSLDPLATGLLPLCFGHATKISAYLLDADKSYFFSCQLGVTTDTGDAEGAVLERRPVGELDRQRIETALTGLRGDIEQLPPMYSALKHRGKRLYQLAREGVEVERQRRPVTIHELTLVAIEQGHGRIDCRVRCSKGTYVRTLAEDIGAALGCGAHVSRLRRDGVSPYGLDRAVTPERLQQTFDEGGYDALDALLLPTDSALSGWPEVRLDEQRSFFVRSGNPVRVQRAPASGWVRLYGPAQFLGIGEMLPDGRVAPRRLFV